MQWKKASYGISIMGMTEHRRTSFDHIHIISQPPLLQAGASVVAASLAVVDFFLRNDNLDFMLLLLVGSLEVEPLLETLSA